MVKTRLWSDFLGFCVAGFLFLVFTGFSGPVLAQSDSTATITGRVVDAESGEALSGANVFLANTMKGTASNEEGEFTIENVRPGSYQLVASVVGYRSDAISVNLQPGQEMTWEFQLYSTGYTLDSLQVAGERPDKWDERFEEFRTQFLGSTENAEETQILNKYVLDFEKKPSGVMVARAEQLLEIENRALGYRVLFDLTSFSWNPETLNFVLRGRPFFEQMEPQSPEEREKWRRNRYQTYQGSFPHFMWALVNNRTRVEGYSLRLDLRVNGPVSKKPAELKYVAPEEILERTKREDVYKLDLNFSYLVIRYKNEEYTWLKKTNNRKKEVLVEGTAYHFPNQVRVWGHMGMERVADLLPREYLVKQFHRSPEEQRQPVHVASSQQSDQTGGERSGQTASAGTTRGPQLDEALPQNWHRYPQPEDEQLMKAWELMVAREWNGADQTLDQYIDDHSEDLEARYYRGIVNRELAKFQAIAEYGHWFRGINDFRFIVERDSSYRDVLYQYALFSRINKAVSGIIGEDKNLSFTDAIELGHAQLRVRPEEPEHHYHLYTLYRRYISRELPEEALDWLDLNPTDYAWFFSGELLRRQGNLQEAEEIFTSILSSERLDIPRQPVLLAQARVHYENGERMEAQEYVYEAINSISAPYEAGLVFEDFKYVIDQEELDRYKSLVTAEEYRQFFRGMWKDRDPMPAREVNVRLAEHYDRIVVAEREYSYDGFRIWYNNPDQLSDLNYPATYHLNHEFNDKGLIYIRHGEPADRITTVNSPNTNNAWVMEQFKSAFGGSRYFPAGMSPNDEWLPNESWRYNNPEMDFHFIQAEEAMGNNWRLVPAITNASMILDREQWGGIYSQLASAVRSMNESGEGAHWAAQDLNSGFNRMVTQSRENVKTALSSDTHTWDRKVQPMDIPHVLAAFRGPGGQTQVEMHFALPLGQLSEALSSDEGDVRVETGFSLMDENWRTVRSVVDTVQMIPHHDKTTAAVNVAQTVVPPDSYRVSFHARSLKSPHLGGYKYGRRIPDLTGEGLAISDILPAYNIEATGESSRFTRQGLRLEVNPFARFATDQPMFVFFEVYGLVLDQSDQTDYTVEYTLEPIDQDRGIFARLFGGGGESISLEVNRSGNLVSPVEYGQIDVGEVPPGTYNLIVRVTDKISGSTVERSREITLTSP